MKTNKQATGSNSQDRRALSRRGFLANTALIGAGLAIGPSLWASSADQPKEINWAYMVMSALAWNLKAWYGLLSPIANEVLEILLRMEFRRILHLIVLLPVQILHSGLRIMCRIMGYNNWLKDFCYLGVSSPDGARLK